MKQILAYFLTLLLLLQSFGRELLVVSYELNKASVTARYCVNKARPELRCDGQCHLARQLRKTEDGGGKVPAGSVAKVKFEVLPLSSATHVARRAPRHWFATPCPYPPLALGRHADAPITGVFRPPIS